MAVIQRLSPKCGHSCTRWSLGYFHVIRANKSFWINDPNEIFIIRLAILKLFVLWAVVLRARIKLNLDPDFVLN